MNNINENFEDKINLLKNKIEDIVSMVDKKPDFYNNIFFEKNNKPIPLNLVNTKYINAKIVEEAKKNKALWINQKGFNQYISKETVLKNSHMIKNYIYTEPLQENDYNFRQIQKTKCVGKNDFFHYQNIHI